MTERTRDRLRGLHQVLSKINNAAILKAIVIVLGAAATTTGLILLGAPEERLTLATIADGKLTWGTLFFGVGVVVVIIAVLRFPLAVLPCCVMSILFGIYGVVSILNVVSGSGVGINATWAMAMTLLGLLGALAAAVPRIEALIEEEVS